MTPDPITVYVAKVAGTSTFGAVAAGWGAWAASGPSEYVGVGIGVSAIIAAVVKLYSDHSAVSNERESNREDNARLLAKVEALEAQLDVQVNLRQRAEIEALRQSLMRTHQIPPPSEGTP